MKLTSTKTETIELEIELPAFFKKGHCYYAFFSEEKKFELNIMPEIGWVGIGKPGIIMVTAENQISKAEFDAAVQECASLALPILESIKSELNNF